MYALAQEMSVGISIMNLALNEVVLYSLYKRCKGQLLPEKNNRENRWINAKTLLNKVKHPVKPETICFFSDEKNFCQLHNFLEQQMACLQFIWRSLCHENHVFPKGDGCWIWWCHATHIFLNRISGTIKIPLWSCWTPLSILGWWCWLMDDHMRGNKIKFLATPPGIVRSGCQIIITSYLASKSDTLTALIVIPWIIMWGRGCERHQRHCL